MSKSYSSGYADEHVQLGQIEKENLGLSMENARLQDNELGTLTVAQRTAPMTYPPSYSSYSSSSSSSFAQNAGSIFQQPQQPQGRNFQQEFDARVRHPTDGNAARRDAKTTARDAAVPAAVWAHNPHPPYPPAAAPHVVLPPHLRTQPRGYDNGKPYLGR